MSLDQYDAPNGSYTSAIPLGTKAFREVLAEKFGFTRTEVVRDKSRCAGQRSEHCECGAVDFFTTDLLKGRKVFEFCVEHSVKLGIQSVIFNRRVVGFGDPDERYYDGQSPHTDHVHVGLNRWARKNLTKALVLSCFDDEEDWLSELTPQEQRQLFEDTAYIAQQLRDKQSGDLPAAHTWEAMQEIRDKLRDGTAASPTPLDRLQKVETDVAAIKLKVQA